MVPRLLGFGFRDLSSIHGRLGHVRLRRGLGGFCPFGSRCVYVRVQGFDLNDEDFCNDRSGRIFKNRVSTWI